MIGVYQRWQRIRSGSDRTRISLFFLGSGSTCYNKTGSGSGYSDFNFQKYPCDSNFPNSKCLFLRKFRCCNRFFRSTCFGDRLTVHSSPSSCGVVNGRVDSWKMLGGVQYTEYSGESILRFISLLCRNFYNFLLFLLPVLLISVFAAHTTGCI